MAPPVHNNQSAAIKFWMKWEKSIISFWFILGMISTVVAAIFLSEAVEVLLPRPLLPRILVVSSLAFLVYSLGYVHRDHLRNRGGWIGWLVGNGIMSLIVVIHFIYQNYTTVDDIVLHIMISIFVLTLVLVVKPRNDFGLVQYFLQQPLLAATVYDHGVGLWHFVGFCILFFGTIVHGFDMHVFVHAAEDSSVEPHVDPHVPHIELYVEPSLPPRSSVKPPVETPPPPDDVSPSRSSVGPSVDEYAANHPDGRIRKSLSFKVKDQMKKEKELPLCREQDLIMDQLVEMTSKDCAGGKGTWGKSLDSDFDSGIVKNDPNNDSGEEPYERVATTVVSDPLDDYMKAVVSLIEKYFSTGDVHVAASDLKELGSSEYHPYFIKRLVSIAMDRNNKEKEMASVLLSALYADAIDPAQIIRGFFMLLESSDILSLFITRAVVDDILPPTFIPDARKMLPEASVGFQVLRTAEKSYVSSPHQAELVKRQWGGSTQLTVDEVKKKITDLLKEYVKSGDISEARRCITQLGVSNFRHEVVKRALVLAMEIQTAQPIILKLLRVAADEGLISSSQMVKGFTRLSESIDDLALDIPSAKNTFQSFVPKAVSEGWLDASYLKSADEDGKKPDKNDEKLVLYKKEVVTIIHKYFCTDDIPELIRSLKDLAMPGYNPVFLKRLITGAMDRKNREKEMASVLVGSLSLYIQFFSKEDIVNGFVMLLESAEDSALDIRDASRELAFFLARAVIDDVLSPVNLQDIANMLPENCSSGSETVRMARTLTATRHDRERILRLWVPGGLQRTRSISFYKNTKVVGS